MLRNSKTNNQVRRLAMKTSIKRIVCAMLVCGIFAGVAAFADSRSDIDKFLKSYEAFVVEAEKAAQKNDLMSLMNLSAKAAEFAEEVDKLDTSSEWTAADLKKYNDLTVRYTNALSKMSGGTSLSF